MERQNKRLNWVGKGTLFPGYLDNNTNNIYKNYRTKNIRRNNMKRKKHSIVDDYNTWTGIIENKVKEKRGFRREYTTGYHKLLHRMGSDLSELDEDIQKAMLNYWDLPGRPDYIEYTSQISEFDGDIYFKWIDGMPAVDSIVGLDFSTENISYHDKVQVRGGVYPILYQFSSNEINLIYQLLPKIKI